MSDIAQKVKNIQLHTKRLLKMNLLGHARSALKGSGLEFEQLRDYQIGDDVRALDWKSSARINRLLVKEFTEEKYRTIFIVLDTSSSTFYGSNNSLKSDIMQQVSALISYAAHLAHDEIGLILFADTIQKYIPASKGDSHIRMILETMFGVKNKKTKTNINNALEYVAGLRKKNAMVFLVSDFISDDYEHKLALVSQQYDVIAVRIIDQFESTLPDFGLLTIQDCESNQIVCIDTRKNSGISTLLQERLEHQKKIFHKNGIDVLEIAHNADLLMSLKHFFRLRKR